MMEPYSAPGARVAAASASPRAGRHWLLLLCIFFCWLFVSHLSEPLITFLLSLDARTMSASMTPELVLDLFLSSVCLALGGYFISSLYGRRGWLVVGLVAAGFTVNTVRIIGLGHVLEMSCTYLWYDIAVILKNPLALFAGWLFWRRRHGARLQISPETP